MECERAVIERRHFRHDGNTRAKTHSKTGPLSEPPTQKRRNASKKKEPQSPKSIRDGCSTALQTLFERYLHQVTL